MSEYQTLLPDLSYFPLSSSSICLLGRGGPQGSGRGPAASCVTGEGGRSQSGVGVAGGRMGVPDVGCVWGCPRASRSALGSGSPRLEHRDPSTPLLLPSPLVFQTAPPPLCPSYSTNQTALPGQKETRGRRRERRARQALLDRRCSVGRGLQEKPREGGRQGWAWRRQRR